MGPANFSTHYILTFPHNTHTPQACQPVEPPHDLSVTQACVAASASVGRLLERLERFVRDVIAAVRGTDKRSSNMS